MHRMWRKSKLSSPALKRGDNQFCENKHGQDEKHTGRHRLFDLTNQRFGKLVALKYVGNSSWECKCDCGNIVTVKTNHLISDRTQSCGCDAKSHGENLLLSLLKSLKIPFVREKTFDNCRFPNTNRMARFDFYLPTKNIAIEYNGIQHYEYREDNSGWNTKEKFEKTVNRDNYKKQWCQDNGIKLITIPYIDYKKLDNNYLLNLINN